MIQLSQVLFVKQHLKLLLLVWKLDYSPRFYFNPIAYLNDLSPLLTLKLGNIWYSFVFSSLFPTGAGMPITTRLSV